MVQLSCRLLLAYGCSPDQVELDPVLAALSPYLTEAGFEPRFLALDPAASDAELQARFAAEAARLSASGLLAVGGFSLGARIASIALNSTTAAGLLCFGYPFYSRTDPKAHPGLNALREVTRPTLVVQGTRDPYGNSERVANVSGLPANVELHWLSDGNHRFTPRANAAHSQEELVASAAHAALAFLKRVPSSLAASDTHGG